MSMRVATFSTSSRMLAAALRTQSKMAELQTQQASGSIATTYGGLGSSSRAVLDLETSLARAKSYGSAASEASGRVDVLYSTLSSITDLLTSFRGQLTTMMSSDANASTTHGLVSTADSDLSELASLLNTTYEGRYLFGGDATQSQPVSLEGYTADSATVSTSYYRGDDAVAAVRISRDQTVAYGITADNPAFEQALRALGSIAGANTDSLTSEQLQSAYDLVVSALDATIGVQSALSGHAATIDRAVERQADYETLLTSSISQLKDADVTSITVQLTNYQTQLEASYSAIAKVQSLSLVSYLK